MRSIDREAHDSQASFATLLFRYLWPFWLFRDAARGDRTARAAAYRHNRSMRIHLPGYLIKWMFGSALAYALTAGFDSLALAAAHSRTMPHHLFTALTAGASIMFAGSVCVLLMTGYVYLYLGKHAS